MPPYNFQSLFGYPNRYELLLSINNFNNNYLAITSNDGFSSGNTELDLRLIDEFGSIITLKNIHLPNINLVATAKKPAIHWQDSSIYIAGRMAGNVWHGMLWKINKNLDTLWHKEYTNPIADSALQFASSTIVKDGLIIYGTSNQYDVYGDDFIMKVDFNGNEIWRKTVQVAGQEGAILKIIHTLDKSFICYQDIIYPNTDTDYRVVKYDSLFNQVWAQTYYTPYFDYEGDLIETSDSNYVICNGYTDIMAGGVMGTPKSRSNLLKINKSNGSIIWDKKYGTTFNFTELKRVQELHNGNLIAIGSHVTPYVGQKPKGAYVPHIMSFNSNGDSLSYQTVFADSSSTVNRLWDFCKTNTGYFFVGDASDVTIGNNDQNWLIKADTNICFLSNCTSTTGLNIQKRNTEPITFFPNPAQNSVTITIPSNQIITLKIIDVLGKIVFQQEVRNETNTINTSQFSNGTYIVQFTKDDDIFNKLLIINH